MHSLLRPLGRTSLFPLASGALALLAVLGLGMAFGLRADAQNADQIVARVNGTDLKASDVAIAEEDIGASLQQIPPESRREYLTSYLTDMTLVAKVSDRVLAMNQGEVLAVGTPREVQSHPGVAEAYLGTVDEVSDLRRAAA